MGFSEPWTTPIYLARVPRGSNWSVTADPRFDVLEQLVRSVGGNAAPLDVLEMPGGASTRRFFRVALNREERAIAMFVPDSSRPDEIAKEDGAGRRWPFLEVRDLLHERGVRVPRVLAEACDEGFILVEDLGDYTLARYLEDHPERREFLYRRAIADIARAQQVLEHLPAGSVVDSRTFDVDLLRWELDHFREWAIEAQGVTLTRSDQVAFNDLADGLAQTIASGPQAFVHRDYQSRNLMVRTSDDGQSESSPELVWIDFQDALRGPRVYDLVALLNDSYQQFKPSFVQERLDEYVQHLGGDASERVRVGLEFDLVTVQRKLKDAGRFIFIDREKGNPSFLGFVASTLEKALVALRRLPPELGLGPLEEFAERALHATPR